MDSILQSIKKLLGVGEDYEIFDADIIMHINTVFAILAQLGAGPPDGFSITDDSAVWADYSTNGSFNEAVKTYIYLKVKLIFDPPLSAAAVETIKELIKELEWRLNVEFDTPKPTAKEEIQNE